MFTQEDFESAYEIISGFNNIRKQINDDPKLLTKLYENYIQQGFKIERNSDVDKFFTLRVRHAVLYCYLSLGYPLEYDKNIYEYFDLLSQVILVKDKNLDYSEYEIIWGNPLFAQRREYFKDIYNLVQTPENHKYSFFQLYSDLLEIDEYIAEKYLILIKKLVLQLKKSKYVTSDGEIWWQKLIYDDLGLKQDYKPEYRIKSEENFKFTIDSDFFDLIDNITREFDSFVKSELLGLESIYSYFISHELYCGIANDEATLWGNVNSNSGTWASATKCTSAQWTALAAKGCVFLPAAGRRYGNVEVVGTNGYYSSSTSPNTGMSGYCHIMSIAQSYFDPVNGVRSRGCSVRLVYDVE